MDLRGPYLSYTMHMQLFHALNRRVEKRTLFLDEKDYVRFVHNLYVFNDTAPTDANNGHWFRTHSTNMDLVGPYLKLDRKIRLVDLHGWCLMKNHYHLLLSERVENGITQFLRKLNVGYAKYFNEKYKRSGTLFQGRTKKIPIITDAQFNYILHYIHLNPLDYLEGAKKWRIRDKDGIRNMRESVTYLDTYRWSSYLDYIGKNNFPSILTTSLFKEKKNSYKNDLSLYLKDTETDFPTQLDLE